MLFKKDFSNTLSPLILILQSVTQIFKILNNNQVKNKKNKTIETLFKKINMQLSIRISRVLSMDGHLSGKYFAIFLKRSVYRFRLTMRFLLQIGFSQTS
ncbi:hypothetical protein AEY54_03775 [Helicobacter pylori]|nr:hypothetical protein AEY54_03775 [Helicobacter pylori]